MDPILALLLIALIITYRYSH
jgi:hypothetical protein